MGSFSDFLENKILNHVFGGVTYAAPSTLYLGLSTTTIAEDGTNITEPSGGAYARVAITNNATNFPNATDGEKANGTVISFARATGDWGDIIDFFVADAVTSGNILGFGTLEDPKTVDSGDTLSFDPDAIILTLT